VIQQSNLFAFVCSRHLGGIASETIDLFAKTFNLPPAFMTILAAVRALLCLIKRSN